MKSIVHTTPGQSVGDVIRDDYKTFFKLPFLHEILDLLPQVAFILNYDREIVITNKALLHMFGLEDMELILSQRPGNLFHCIHVKDGKDGCGTSDFCKVCGIANAILECQKHFLTVSSKAFVKTEIGNRHSNYELLITATPFEYKQKLFTIISIAELGNTRKRGYVDRMFIHDVENRHEIIDGFCTIMKDTELNEQYQFVSLIRAATFDLMGEVRIQRQIALAEKGELKLNKTKINSMSLLFNIRERFQESCKRKGCNLTISESSFTAIVESDENILLYCLLHLCQNAIEASLGGDSIKLSAEIIENSISFSIFSDTLIPYKEQYKIFKKNYSTKGKGRGLGTYSVKLFVEKYLQGVVTFESEVESGTIFTITLPL